MVGGDEEVVERVRPLFERWARRSSTRAARGAGQHTKMVNQILIATHMIGVCEALLYGYKAGLDLETVLRAVEQGAAGSWCLTNLGAADDRRQLRARFLRRALPQGHGHRPGRGAADEPALPGLALAQQLYSRLMAQGQGRKGTQALMLALASLSNVDWSASVDVAHRQTLSPSSRRSNRSPQRWHVGGRICARTSSPRRRRSRASPRGRGARAA